MPRLAARSLIVVSLVILAFAAGGCRLIGTGQLHVQNDLSGLGRNNTVIGAFIPDIGEPFPGRDEIAIYVRGDDFGRPPAFGLNGYLYLVRTELPCPESEAAPEVFRLNQVVVVGIITVRDGSVDQVVSMQNQQGSRDPTWALMDVGQLPEGGHYIHRCGTVTWTS
jgi:hypothetical protein